MRRSLAMGAGSSWDSMRLGFSRGTLAESSYVGSEESLGPEETSRTLFLSEARLVTLAQGFTLSGSLYMRASGRSSVTASGRSSITASGRYRKVDAVIEGTVLCCADCKVGLQTYGLGLSSVGLGLPCSRCSR